MSSYNQTKNIMEELKLKIKSASTVSNKKVFVVVLEGTESEFDEIRKLGGVEIENLDIFSNIPSTLENIRSTSCLDNSMSNTRYEASKHINNSLIVNTGSIVTEGDIVNLSEETKEIVLKDRGMITPLAIDLAKKRGIKVVKVKS